MATTTPMASMFVWMDGLAQQMRSASSARSDENTGNHTRSHFRNLEHSRYQFSMFVFTCETLDGIGQYDDNNNLVVYENICQSGLQMVATCTTLGYLNAIPTG